MRNIPQVLQNMKEANTTPSESTVNNYVEYYSTESTHALKLGVMDDSENILLNVVVDMSVNPGMEITAQQMRERFRELMEFLKPSMPF